MKQLLLLFIALLFPIQAFAVGTVKSPYATEGEFEVDYKGSVTHDDDDKDQKNQQKQVLDLAYGFAPKWAAEVEVGFEREAGDNGIDLEEIEFEVKRQLTDKGDYWWDMGVLGVYGHATDEHAADKIEAIFLAQNTISNITTRANIGLEHAFGQDGHDIALWGRAFTRYNLSPVFKPGIEWQGEFGPVDDMGSPSDQEHFAGPVAFGHIPFLEKLVGGNGEFEYELGYLFGLTEESPDGAIRWKLEYKTRF